MAGTCSECDRGFIVMNRPWGVVQVRSPLIATNELRHLIVMNRPWGVVQFVEGEHFCDLP